MPKQNGTKGVPEQVETRSFVEFRVDDEGERVTIAGHASTFNDPYPVWDFLEQVAPGAFSESIEDDDIRALLNHDPNHLLGRNKAGTLRLTEDDVGLAAEIDLPSSRGDVLESIERGDLDQMSFGFEVLGEEWAETDDGPDLRTITKAKLWDVSPVTFPANDKTDIAVQRHREFRSQVEVEDRQAHLDEARVPNFSGTEEGEWEAPNLEDYRVGLDLPEDVDWPDLEEDHRQRIVDHTLIGSASAETFDEANFFPVVDPRSGNLNANALRNAISRAPQADVPSETQESIQSVGRSLLDEHFGNEEEEGGSVNGQRLQRIQRQAEAELTL